MFSNFTKTELTHTKLNNNNIIFLENENENENPSGALDEEKYALKIKSQKS